MAASRGHLLALLPVPHCQCVVVVQTSGRQQLHEERGAVTITTAGRVRGVMTVVDTIHSIHYDHNAQQVLSVLSYNLVHRMTT